jgi:hypothetical protein
MKLPTIVNDAKNYLWRLGCNPDTTQDPNELIGGLVREYEALSKENKQLSEKLVDRAAGIEPDVQLPLMTTAA